MDLDIHNCQFTLLTQIVDKMELQGEYFAKMFEPIRKCAESRDVMREPQIAWVPLGCVAITGDQLDLWRSCRYCNDASRTSFVP